MSDIDLNTTPLNSYWLHHNGNIYVITKITNGTSVRQHKYPTTICYDNVATGEEWSRRYVDWHDSMKRVKLVNGVFVL